MVLGYNGVKTMAVKYLKPGQKPTSDKPVGGK